MAVEAVVQMILSTPDIEGVTFSGGEPMAQALALAVVAERLREHGLSIVCYSGYQLEEIRQMADPGPGQLLKQLDVLIDGRYVETERHSLLWRGSRHQRIHFLTDRYRQWELTLRDAEGEIELTVGQEGFIASGVLDAELLRRLRQALEAEPSANGGMIT
jgi:anaerobic ribonucleoside-triphosphate reductase activating protein